jgi:hypothetical protein
VKIEQLTSLPELIQRVVPKEESMIWNMPLNISHSRPKRTSRGVMATDQQDPGSPLLKLPEEILMMILRKVGTPHILEVALS